MEKTTKNIAYQISYRILTVITPLITSPIVSRALGPDNLGIYSATQALANYFMFIAMLGIEKYGQRMIAGAQSDPERQKLFWEIYSVQLVSSVTAIVSYYLMVLVMGGSRFTVMMLQGLWVISCLLDISWFFFGKEEFRITVTRNLVIKTMTVLGIILFVHDTSDLLLYVIIMAGGTALSQLILWLSLFRRIQFQKPGWADIRAHVKPILRLFVPVIALSVFHIMDKTMLDIFSTESEVGWYYAVDKIVYIPLGLILAVGTVMLSRVSFILKNGTKDDASQLLEKSMEFTLFLTCAVTFGIAAICEEFIPFFFGPGYEPCVSLMYLFLPVLLIKAVGDVVRTQYLIAAGKDNVYTGAVIGGALSNLVFNLLLIPHFGAKGAVVGSLIAEFVVLTVQIAGCKKEIPFMTFLLKHAAYLPIGAVMFFLVRMAISAYRPASPFLQIALMVFTGAAVYFVLCFIYWKKDKNSIFYQYLQRRKTISGS